jgi:hypothetical protein
VRACSDKAKSVDNVIVLCRLLKTGCMSKGRLNNV